MAISLFSGLPGSGKSYSVFENVIIPELKQGRQVFTNIPFNDEACLATCGNIPQTFDIRDIEENDGWFEEVFVKGSILVLDECWRLWPSGLRANKINEKHKVFLAEHRHTVGENGKSTEIYLCTQDASQLASFVRNLIETTYRSVKLSAVGQDTRYRVDIYHGVVTGQNPPERQRLRQLLGKYKPEVYNLYQSHTKSETGEAGDETKADKRANIMQSFGIKSIPWMIGAAFALLVFAYNAVAAFFSPEEMPKVEQTFNAQPVVREPKKLDLLEGTEVQIAFNNGTMPNIDYVLKIKKGDKNYRLTSSELLSLGYTLQPINRCLLIVKVNGKDYVAACVDAEKDAILDFNWQPGGGTDT